jgi:hypothetical protein
MTTRHFRGDVNDHVFLAADHPATAELEQNHSGVDVIVARGARAS